MQLRKLHRLLGEKIEKGFSRAEVCINKNSFAHPLERDGVIILRVESIKVESVLILNEDGWLSDENGVEKHKRKIVLYGEGR